MTPLSDEQIAELPDWAQSFATEKTWHIERHGNGVNCISRPFLDELLAVAADARIEARRLAAENEKLAQLAGAVFRIWEDYSGDDYATKQLFTPLEDAGIIERCPEDYQGNDGIDVYMDPDDDIISVHKTALGVAAVAAAKRAEDDKA